MKTGRAVMALLAGVVFALSFIYRFNDPGGSFAGLTDDHFFYLVRGWQILFGDLPVRDFVDHGAPLFYYVGAAVQAVFGRGTLSEIAFTTSMLSLSAALTFVLAARASGSIVAGLAAAAIHVVLEPRFYNYPKVLVYAVAIPLIWHYANKPSIGRVAWVAVATVVAFLFRHDHGVFVGIALLALMVALTQVPWTVRLRHAVAYGLLSLALIAPYLVFIQLNGGIVSYFRQASEWAARDRVREPVVWPGLFDNPDGVSPAALEGGFVSRAVAVVQDNAIAWLYYLEIVIPALALVLLAVGRDALRPGWPQATAKIFSLAVLGAVLDAGFLRSSLEARLADPSVPLVVLIAWMAAGAVRLVWSDASVRPALQWLSTPLRVTAPAVVAVLVLVTATALLRPGVARRLELVGLSEGVGKVVERTGVVRDELRQVWRMESWPERPGRSELLDLAMYLNACTAPSDRILVQEYLPQLVALARRGFAGGHADLRPGFFVDLEAQQLTVQRLRAQSVPLVLLATDDEYENFRKEFPLVTAFLDSNYEVAGIREFDGRYGITLLAERRRQQTGTYEPYGWPCFGSGRPQS